MAPDSTGVARGTGIGRGWRIRHPARREYCRHQPGPERSSIRPSLTHHPRLAWASGTVQNRIGARSDPPSRSISRPARQPYLAIQDPSRSAILCCARAPEGYLSGSKTSRSSGNDGSHGVGLPASTGAVKTLYSREPAAGRAEPEEPKQPCGGDSHLQAPEASRVRPPTGSTSGLGRGSWMEDWRR
jgi:hypothetical protein